MSIERECCICLEETFCSTHFNNNNKCEGGYMCDKCIQLMETEFCPVCNQPRNFTALSINQIDTPIKETKLRKCIQCFSKVWKRFVFKDCIKIFSLILMWFLNYIILSAFQIEDFEEYHKSLISIVLAFTEYCIIWFIIDCLIYIFQESEEE